MILDRAQDLVALVNGASAAADQSTATAAKDQVAGILDRVRTQLTMFAVGGEPWLGQLDAETRVALTEAGSALSSTLSPLRGLGGAELVAHARTTDVNGRGLLAAIERSSDRLLKQLLVAQDALLGGWIDELWPDQDRVRLKVLAHLPETRERAALVVRTRAMLAERIDDGRTLDTDGLSRLRRAFDDAESAIEELGSSEVPAAVLAFWEAADASEEGVALRDLSADVLAWLHEHGAARAFLVKSAS